jgi:peptidoglycan/LPS O-acetylase OafA/YrhL
MSQTACPPSAAPAGEQPQEPRTKQRIVGLDGLRAFAVFTVMLYHARIGWVKGGGFLGVEVFFVISGFLITGLLLKENRDSGRIRFWPFWLRRMRRLFPALFVLLLALGAYGVLRLGTEASQYRLDLFWSLVYWENWHQILSGSSYFAEQGLPLLRHMWSLAVEGQFYLAWPLAVALALRAFGQRVRPLLALTVVLAAVSLGLMLGLADPNHPSSAWAAETLNRAYLGTDTRALGLLAGALLALGLEVRGGPAAPVRGRLLGAAALLALAALTWIMHAVEVTTAFLYRGGFLLVDALTVLVILALLAPGPNPVRWVLGRRPLEWCGQRAYGLYLWHWPVFRLLWPEHQGWLPFLGRTAVSVALAYVSFRWIEQPLQSAGSWGWLHWSPAGWSSRRRHLPRFAAAALVLAAILESTALARRADYVDPVQASIQAGAQALDSLAPATLPSVLPAPGPAPAPTGARPAAPGPALEDVVLPDELNGLRLTAVGDSVMKGAAVTLKRMGEASLGDGMIQINAEECRPFGRAIEVLRGYQREKRLGEVVVIHLGTNNSSIPASQFRSLMNLLADRRLVLFLTVRSEHADACEKVNKALESLVMEFPNARVFDWSGASGTHPELFYADHTHLRPEGSQFYARMILTQIAALPPQAAAPD